MTLYVNLFGGPGIGKSTSAAGLSWILRKSGRRTEYITEVAKTLVWEGNIATLSDQLLIFALQRHQELIVMGKVDVAITDSPTFLSAIYDTSSDDLMRRQLSDIILTDFRSKRCLNIVLRRTTSFDPAGRIHSEEQSILLDHAIVTALSTFGFRYHVVDPSNVERMEALVASALADPEFCDKESDRPSSSSFD